MLLLLPPVLKLPLAIESAEHLKKQGTAARVVSMPSVDVFESQDQHYRHSVLPPGTPIVAIEAGTSDYWTQFTGCKEAVVGIDTFGESAPAKALFKHFGFTVENVCKKVENVLQFVYC